MEKTMSLIKKAISKSSCLSEAIADVWTHTRFWSNNPEAGRMLVDTLYYVECWSTGADDFILPEKIGSPEWYTLQECLQEFCNRYDVEDWVGYEYPAIILDQMNTSPRRVQLCSIYTGLLNVWNYIFDNPRTYKVLEATARVGCLDSHYIEYIYKRIGQEK